MRFSQSIVSRIVLLFTTLLLLSILLTGYLVYTRSSGVISDYSRERVLHASELAQQTFYSLLDEVSTDVGVIASGPVIREYIENPSNESAEAVESLFKTFLEKKDSYFQLRFIGVEDQGREIIRLDKKNGQVVKSLSLQRKGDREYFKEGISMPEGGIYYSRIDLNEEFGVISEPRIPTLRVATPIYKNRDQILGLIVINLNLSQLYEMLRRIPGAGSELYLIDESGQYLFAPDKTLQFDSQLKHGRNFYSDFSSEKDKRDDLLEEDFRPLKNKFSEVMYLGFSRELLYFNGKRKIRLLSLIDQQSILKSAQEVRDYSMKAVVVVGLLVILVTLLFARYFSNFLTQITNALGNYESIDLNASHLPVNREDEIGILARTFVKMKGRIDQNMERINKALEHEQNAKNQRDEFLQNMSHEMRTPLNAILGLTKLLQKNESNRDQIPLINALDRSAQSLSGLVYDVLDHQNLVEGKVIIDMKPTKISDILRDIHSTYQYDAVQKGLEFELIIRDELDKRSYLTDALRLSQIVINLVTNATKYTVSGKIVLEAGLTGKESRDLEIRVSDTGIGIKPENLEKINDRYFRVEEGLSGRENGYGLGLSIVKQLTALFGGTLSASSEMGKGSVFVVTIPSEPADLLEDLDRKGQAQVSFPLFSKKMSVLHIEDDLSTLDLVQELFKHSAIEFDQVSEAEKAGKMLKEKSYDLIISDLFLNSENIESRLEQWLNMGYISSPLIVVSGRSQPEPSKPNVFYMEKPFEVDCFKDLVYVLLGESLLIRPDFGKLYQNYDQNTQKILQVLALLKDEFLIYLKRIQQVSGSKDQKEWEGIRHKLINQINTLNLKRLKELLPERVTDLNQDALEEIQSLFDYYQCCIRFEICQLSGRKSVKKSTD